LKLNPAPHVPDDIVDSVLQQFQPALERPGIRHNGMGGKEGCCDRWKLLRASWLISSPTLNFSISFFPALFDRLHFQERNYFLKGHPLFSLGLSELILPGGAGLSISELRNNG
jgi:hypothetical protein